MLAPLVLLPIITAFAGLLGDIFTARSVQTSAFWGIVGLFLAHLVLRVGSIGDLHSTLRLMLDALEDAGRSLVLIGILLVGAQIVDSIIK